jgi:hypothetical protein
MKAYDGYRGCYSRNEVPSLKPGEGCVINLDTGSGTHWVCMANVKGELLYFDSYGMPPVSKSADFYSSYQYQALESTMCGYFCIFVLRKLLDGESMIDILSEFKSKPEENDKLLKEKFRLK